MKRRLGGLDPAGLMRSAMDEKGAETGAALPLIPGYAVKSILGRGAAGTVYHAVRESLGRAVAIKCLNPEHVSDVLQRERLLREARVMAAISHPHVVTIYDLIECGESLGIVMEYVAGRTLRERLREEAPLSVEEATRLFRALASALGEVHRAGLTHRDLKPENVLLAENGEPKVTDFGIAFAEDDAAPRITLTGMTLGTVGYMSPEQAEGRPVDARSDLYSLAVVYHELLTGAAPDGFLEPPRRLRREIPPHIDEAVVRALDPEPSARFPGAAEFAAAVSPPPPARRWWRLGR